VDETRIEPRNFWPVSPTLHQLSYPARTFSLNLPTKLHVLGLGHPFSDLNKLFGLLFKTILLGFFVVVVFFHVFVKCILLAFYKHFVSSNGSVKVHIHFGEEKGDSSLCQQISEICR
jgi:hypothetical protein